MIIISQSSAWGRQAASLSYIRRVSVWWVGPAYFTAAERSNAVSHALLTKFVENNVYFCCGKRALEQKTRTTNRPRRLKWKHGRERITWRHCHWINDHARSLQNYLTKICFVFRNLLNWKCAQKRYNELKQLKQKILIFCFKTENYRMNKTRNTIILYSNCNWFWTGLIIFYYTTFRYYICFTIYTFRNALH